MWPTEKIRTLIEQTACEGGWEAKTLDQLSNRMKSKIKQLDQTMATNVIQEVRGRFSKMYQKSVCSVC